jgi:putative SOS response-associated peptidase YedK
VPHWAKELKTCFSTINARAETLDRKPEHSRVLAVLTYLRESKS